MYKTIEKIISEIGASPILKERIHLRDDQILTLGQELQSLVDENHSLKEKNLSLEQENEEFKVQNQQQAEKIESLNNIITGQNTHNEIEKIAEETLKQMFESDQSFSAEQFTLSLGLKPGESKYHFDILLEKKLIQIKTMAKPIGKFVNARRREKLPDQPATYIITPDSTKNSFTHLIYL